MDRVQNPYAPGAGLQPPELAGRDSLLETARIDFERVISGRPTRGMILLGLRGVGKTVLINRLAEMARGKKFHVIKIEAPEGGALAKLLIPEMRQVLHELDILAAAGAKLKTALSVLRNFAAAFKITIGDVGVGLDPAPGRADTGNLEQDVPALLIALAEAAAEKKTALAVLIDEVQYLNAAELASVIIACHEISQRNLPLIFIGAGLPQIAALAGNAKSYAERLFSYPDIGPLDDNSARMALIKPALNENVEYEEAAIIEILRLTERYPYFIQEWGAHVWNAAPQSPINFADVSRAEQAVIMHLDTNFFRVRFDRLTPLQQKYLRAMAELGSGPHKTGDIATVLGVEPTAVATVRQQLIAKGMIWSLRHGETAFTVPMFDKFMKRQMPELEKHTPKHRTKDI